MGAKAKAVGVIIVFVIIILIFVGAYQMYSNAWDNAERAMAKGCEPLTADRFGIPTTYSCPPGVHLN